MKNFVEEIYQGFMVRGELYSAFNYLKSTNVPQRAENIEARLQTPYASQTSVPWLEAALAAYWDYLRASWQAMWRCQKLGLTLEGAERHRLLAPIEETLQRELAQALGVELTTSVPALEKNLAKRLTRAGLYFRLGKTAGLYGPYIWQKETITTYQVAMPHSLESVRVHFMRDFLLQGPFSILFDQHFAVPSWGEQADLYCVAVLYEGGLTQPKFQISYLNHETQHQIDSYFHNLSPVHLEYRAKLVELINYSDTLFLNYLLTSGSFAHRGSYASYAAALVVQDLQQFLKETGVADAEAFIAEILAKLLEWMRARGRVQQAALAIFDRDTRKILDKQHKELPQRFLP